MMSRLRRLWDALASSVDPAGCDCYVCPEHDVSVVRLLDIGYEKGKAEADARLPHILPLLLDNGWTCAPGHRAFAPTRDVQEITITLRKGGE
jgi:hypothetical protein